MFFWPWVFTVIIIDTFARFDKVKASLLKIQTHFSTTIFPDNDSCQRLELITLLEVRTDTTPCGCLMNNLHTLCPLNLQFPACRYPVALIFTFNMSVLSKSSTGHHLIHAHNSQTVQQLGSTFSVSQCRTTHPPQHSILCPF